MAFSNILIFVLTTLSIICYGLIVKIRDIKLYGIKQNLSVLYRFIYYKGNNNSIKYKTNIKQKFQARLNFAILQKKGGVFYMLVANKEKAQQKINKHHVLVHPTPFKQQPQGYEMGSITNDLKRSYSEPIPVTKILGYFSKGHSIMLSDAEVDQNNRFRFVSSSLFAIDVDDDEKKTNPEEILFSLKDKITGLFFTFSHGVKGNRYRLLFQLDRKVNDELKMRGIIEYVANSLKEMGLPVDTQAKNPLQIVRGGKRSILVNPSNKLNTTELLEEVKKTNIKRQAELYNEFEKELRPVPFETLKEMVETIGHIPSGVGEGEKWKRLVVAIKHYVNTGHITDEEGYELFDIISGNEQSYKAWKGLRANGQATIRSLIFEAKQRGYRGKYTYYSNDDKITETYERETIKVKGYIPKEVAIELISRNEKILVDSPTGSGKTTSFMNAFKELASPRKHFYIFAAPTIALTEQNALSHKVRAIKGKTENLFKVVNQDIRNGKRVFISTYDMAPALIDFLRLIDHNMTFTLVVDELHKFVTDYDTNYRYEAIQNLYEISKQAKSFIGLSGTIDDIYKNEFEKVVKIDNGKPQSPCQEFAVYTYEKKDQALIELAKLIEVWTSKRKLLIYIQSLNKIEQLKDVLRRKGIKVRTINANSKSNTTYKQLVETSTIDDDVQVLLTTSVIADGVNIKNSLEWEVIAVCNEFSNLFNYSSVKQISNRMRNEYRRFSIFMQEPRNKRKDPFNLENAYQYRLGIAQNIVTEISEHPYFDIKLFQSSTIERRYGIHLGLEGLEIDTLFLRHAVSREQERYFSGSRFSFINAVERALHTKIKGIINISKEIRENNLELTFIRDIIGQLEEEEKQKEQVKIQSIGQAFTHEVYQAFLEDDEKVLNEFKKTVSSNHYSCLSGICHLANYEICRKIVVQVNRKADIHSFFKSIRGLAESIYLKSVNRPSKTRQVFKGLLQLNEFMSVDDYKKILKQMAKKLKINVKDVEEVENMIICENKRTKKERMKKVSEPITPEYIAEKFGLSVDEVKQVTLNYAKTRGKTFETVVKTKLGM